MGWRFLSIEGVTGEERDIAMNIKDDLINSGVPSEYITFDNATGKVSFLITSGTDPLNTTINFSTGSNTNTNIHTIIGFTNTDVIFTTSLLN